MLARALLDRRMLPFPRASTFLLALWLLTMLYATYRGVRFIMFLIVPLGVFLGWGLRDGLDYFFSRLPARARGVLVALVVAALSVMMFNRGRQIASSMYPLMHDRWYQVLMLVKDKTPPDTTVNSWWDFGDWFKVVAERKVIFDGQTQNRPQAYWMARALLSGNERESIGILRMLNNGGNKAFDLIDSHIKDPLQSALLLETILPLDAGSAKAKLREFLPADAADRVILMLFDEPPNAEFLVDYSLVSKITAISYLGNWNFAKVYIVQNFKRMEKDKILDHLTRLGKDPSQVQKYYQEAFLIPENEIEQWISRPVQYYSEPVRGQKREEIVLFDNGFIYNPQKQIVTSNNGQLPRSVFYKNGSDLEEMVYPNPTLGFSALVWETQDGSWRLVLLDPSLGRSLFTRLYFLGGFGLKHFQERIKAYEGENFIGTYKINW
jgi:dolichyl-diphosphooligosaccharide--protein glycosyltransferase